MKIIDEPLLKSKRTPGRCECCGRYSSMRQPHHLLCRGQEGCRRIDVEENLIALGNQWDCPCHENAQRNREGFERRDMAVIVGKRLGKTAEECIAAVDQIRAL